MANFFKKLFGSKEEVPEENKEITPAADENPEPAASEEPTVEVNESEMPEEGDHVFSKNEIKEAVESDEVPVESIPAKEPESFISKEEIGALIEDDSTEEEPDIIVADPKDELFNETKDAFEESGAEIRVLNLENEQPPEEEAVVQEENGEIFADENPELQNDTGLWVENDSPAEEEKDRPHEYLDVGDGFRQAIKEAEDLVLGDNNEFAKEYCGEKERNLFEVIMRLLVLSPEYRKPIERDAIHEFIAKSEGICRDIHIYDNLAYNDPAIECWDKFSAIELEEEKKYIAMNLLTALKWFRNKVLKDELKENFRKHEEILKDKKEIAEEDKQE